MDANPQVESDINGIRQPLTDLRNRCDAPAPTQHHLGAPARPALTRHRRAEFMNTAATASCSQELR